MQCFDTNNALYALVGSSLIVAGANLMMQEDATTRGYGAYCFAIGYFILGLAISKQNVNNIDIYNVRYLVAMTSIIAIVAGQFLMHYNVQNNVKLALSGQQPQPSKSITPERVLMYGGIIGLISAISLNNDNSFNPVKCILGIGAFLVIGYTRSKYIEAMASGASSSKSQFAQLASWLLLVLAVSYSC